MTLLTTPEPSPLDYLDALFDRLAAMLDLEVYFHFAIAPDGSHLELAAARGISEEQRANMARLEFGQAVCGSVAATREAAVHTDLQGSSDPLTDLVRGLGITAYACWPLVAEGKLIGTLSFGTRRHKAFQPAALALLETLCEYVALTLARSQTRKALRESESNFRAFFENAGVGTTQVDANGRFVRVNNRFCEITGYTRDELLTMGPVDLVPPEDREIEQDRLRKFFSDSGAGFDVEKRYVRKDGRVIWVHATASVVRDAAGNAVLSGGVVADITGRKAAEDSLRESEERFRSMSDGLPLIVWVHNAEGEQEFVNQTFCEFFGVTREEMRGGRWQMLMHPDEADAYRDEFSACIREQRPFKAEVRVRHADGSWRWIQSWGRPRFSPSGTFLGLVGKSADITDRKRAEAALRQSEQDYRDLSRSLEVRVSQRTRQLEVQSARLQILAGELAATEQRERKRLAAILHDDLQQLLVAAKMHLRQTRGRVADARAEEAIKTAADYLAEAVERARDLTRQLRPPVLYEAGLVPALQWLASDMEQRYQLPVRLEASEVRHPLSDDIKALLFGCVRELLFNVSKYAEADDARVLVKSDDGWLEIEVADAGKGFDAVATAQSIGRDGGFGLFSVRERLAALGGEMAIESKLGEGTRVSLRAPITSLSDGRTSPKRERDTASAANDNGDSGKDANHRTVRVLVVDDHALVRQGIANILELDEHLEVVAEAEDGLDAIEAIERVRPDVVLMDVNMPRMNGVDATREIHRRWPGVHIIGLSVQNDAATAQSMLDAGAAAFIPKSGDADRMLDTIAQISRAGAEI